MSEELKNMHAYYRDSDHQYQLAGGEEGCMKLANDFYDVMQNLPEARKILHMHPTDLTESREKLGRFLCGYLNGPDRYEQKYGPLHLAPAHAHLPIGTTEKEAWLLCMQTAVDQQSYPQTFKDFLMLRLSVPAERIRNRP